MVNLKLRVSLLVLSTLLQKSSKTIVNFFGITGLFLLVTTLGFLSGTKAADSRCWQDEIGATWAHNQGYSGKGVQIAVVDPAPVDCTHSAFQDRVSVVQMPKDPNHVYNVNVNMDHTTHICGIIGGNGEDFKGVAPGCLIKAYEGSINSLNLDDGGFNAIIAKDSVKIVNLSLKVERYSSKTWDAFREMIKTGKLLILSAGNNSQDIDFNSSFGAIRRLANCNEYEGAVIIVGACYLKEDGGDLWRDSCRPGDIYASTTSNGFENAKKEQSSTGSIADHYITAPGVYIKSTIAGNKFKDQSGTSFAAPMVAGAACLLWEKYPHWTAVQVKKAILNSASPFSEFPSKFQWAKRCRVEHEEENGITIPYAPNFSEYYGKGMLNIKAMFELAATLSEYQYT